MRVNLCLTEDVIKDSLPLSMGDGSPILMNSSDKDARIVEFSSHLPKYGIRSGQVIGVMLPAGREKILVVTGLLLFGCTSLPLDPSATLHEVRKKVEKAGIKLIFTSIEHIGIASQLKVCLAYLP
jgi:acyl-CoA synthetase (AMP-forming)/AMP-acid ligase II